MGDSSGSVSVDIEIIPWGGQEHVVQTSYGPVSVFVCGDQEKPALITYPDVALNYMSCFQGLFFCPEAASLLFHNFCVYHIDAPGHELGAAAISSNIPVPTVDDLAEQVAEVLDYFGLREVICMGVTAGAYILTLFSIKYKERVAGLILVSPLCRQPSWTEWLYDKLMINLLYFYGMCGLVKETLLQRYFSEGVRSIVAGESDIVQACRRLLQERQSKNVMRFLEAISKRHDLSEGLKKLQCRTLIFVGESSPFHEEALHMHAAMDKRYNALVETWESGTIADLINLVLVGCSVCISIFYTLICNRKLVQACGSLVVEEQPHAMLIPIEYFLMGYGFYRPPQLAEGYGSSPRSPSSTPISAELLSPESLGLKLKPIKTRLAGEE